MGELAGTSAHRHIVETIRNTLEDRRCSVDLPGTVNGSQKRSQPDILCTDGASVFETERDVWIEAETSTLRKPANIIAKFVAAIEHDAKPVFAISAGKKGLSGDAHRLDRILTDPPLMQSRMDGGFQLYHQTEEFPVHSGDEIVGQAAVKPGDGATRGWHKSENGQLYCRDPSVLEIDRSQVDELRPDDVPFVIQHREDKTAILQDGETVGTFSSDEVYDFIPLKKPILPSRYDFDIQSALQRVEYLIVDQSDSVHHRPLTVVTEI